MTDKSDKWLQTALRYPRRRFIPWITLSNPWTTEASTITPMLLRLSIFNWLLRLETRSGLSIRFRELGGSNAGIAWWLNNRFIYLLQDIFAVFFYTAEEKKLADSFRTCKVLPWIILDTNQYLSIIPSICFLMSWARLSDLACTKFSKHHGFENLLFFQEL